MRKQKAESKYGHKQGKYCGCDIQKDGSILVAPTYREPQDSINDRWKAIVRMEETFHLFVLDERARLQREHRELLDMVKDDYAEFLPPEPLDLFPGGIIRTFMDTGKQKDET